MSTSKRVLVLSANSTSDYGDAPDFVVVDDVHQLHTEAKRLQALCIQHKLSEVRVYNEPYWGPGDIADEVRLDGDELVVCSTSFWFTAYPKHANYKVESYNLDFVALDVALAEGGTGVIFLGENPEENKEDYTDDLVSKFDNYDEADKVSDHYDSDAEFASLLRDNLPGFEYPDYSGMTIAQVVERIIASI